MLGSSTCSCFQRKAEFLTCINESAELLEAATTGCVMLL